MRRTRFIWLAALVLGMLPAVASASHSHSSFSIGIGVGYGGGYVSGYYGSGYHGAHYGGAYYGGGYGYRPAYYYPSVAVAYPVARVVAGTWHIAAHEQERIHEGRGDVPGAETARQPDFGPSRHWGRGCQH